MPTTTCQPDPLERIRLGGKARRAIGPVHLRELARSILAGEREAVHWFLSELKPDVAAYVASKCWDGRSRRLANEVVDDVFAECFGGYASSPNAGGRRPLLLKYRGQATLSTWLKRVATNRLITRVKSKEERSRVFPNEDQDAEHLFDTARPGESLEPADPGDTAGSNEDIESNPLREAVQCAIESLRTEAADHLVLLELHFLHGIPKNRLAAAWGVEPSTIGRRIDKTLAGLRRQIRAATPKVRGRSKTGYDVEDFLEVGCAAAFGQHETSKSTAA